MFFKGFSLSLFFLYLIVQQRALAKEVKDGKKSKGEKPMSAKT